MFILNFCERHEFTTWQYFEDFVSHRQDAPVYFPGGARETALQEKSPSWAAYA